MVMSSVVSVCLGMSFISPSLMKDGFAGCIFFGYDF